MTEIGFFVRFFYQELRKTGREGDAVRRTSTGIHDVAAVAYAPTFAVLPDFLISRFILRTAVQLLRSCFVRSQRSD